MPRYFFHVHDGQDIPDIEGTELAGVEQARREAIRYTSELLTDSKAQFWDGADWHVEVTDDTGLVLFVLHFLAVDAPASGGAALDL